MDKINTIRRALLAQELFGSDNESYLISLNMYIDSSRSSRISFSDCNNITIRRDEYFSNSSPVSCKRLSQSVFLRLDNKFVEITTDNYSLKIIVGKHVGESKSLISLNNITLLDGNFEVIVYWRHSNTIPLVKIVKRNENYFKFFNMYSWSNLDLNGGIFNTGSDSLIEVKLAALEQEKFNDKVDRISELADKNSDLLKLLEYSAFLTNDKEKIEIIEKLDKAEDPLLSFILERQLKDYEKANII